MTARRFVQTIVTLLVASALVQTACSADESSKFQCGDALFCGESQICVEMQTFTSQFRCVDDPCGAEALSCDCAASACDFGVCGSAADRKVTCFCPTC